ncbi:MAG TPA: ABC transporter permease [Phytomonospora sp.]
MSHAVTDSATMLRRNLRRAMRYPALTVSMLAMPVLLMLLFVYVLGGALGGGIGGDLRYVDYLTPGIALMTIAVSTMTAAIGVCTDLTEGIIARFRTMPIAPNAVLTARVLDSMIQTLLSVALVIGAATLIGFRPNATLVEWLAAAGLMVLLTFGVTRLAIAMGLLSKNPEGASNIVMPLAYLPFLGSAFVPPDSMSGGIRWFAEHQPFTPIIETVRGLLLGTGIGTSAYWAVGWCLAMTVGGYLWARVTFRKRALSS